MSEDQPVRSKTTGDWPELKQPFTNNLMDRVLGSMSDLELDLLGQRDELLEKNRRLERTNTDLRFVLEAALPGLRDLVNQECPDPSVAERDRIILKQALSALGKSA